MLTSRRSHIRLYSPDIVRTPHADSLLGALAERATCSFFGAADKNGAPDAIAGWGYKKTARRARRIAAKRGLPYIALEDGFLRSVGLGVAGAPPLSFIADDIGIYYDPQGRSRLHEYLARGEAMNPDKLERAARLMQFVRDNRLSKYNTGRADKMPDALSGLTTPAILLVDQTRGDASLSGIARDAFARMIAQARANHPNATLLVKTHPDVLAGKKRGCFNDALYHAPFVRVIADDLCPYSLFDRVEAVYVATSGMGFEALIAGKPVHCFGYPWYAGYGLTHDHAAAPQALAYPRPARPLAALFAAAYIDYPLYIDPYAQAPCSAERGAEILAFLKGRAARHRGTVVAYGISRWKRDAFKPYLCGAARIIHTASGDEALWLAERHHAPIIGWSGKVGDALARQCAARAIPLTRVEDGFIRSVGLGAALTPAASLVFDDAGIYYDARGPSRLEEILQAGIDDPALLLRARALRADIVARGLTKYNTGSADTAGLDLPPDKRVILVAGQVEDDASIRHGTRDIQTDLALLQAARAARPDGYILYKPHPDVVAGLRAGGIRLEEALRHADAVCAHTGAHALLPLADEVHVMSSLIGFEALLRDKEVHVYGLPFYAGWGLTHDRAPYERRTRRLSLDELVAGALILYPDYLDPLSRLPCPPEILLARLAEGRTLAHADGQAMRLWRLLGRCWGAVRP